MLAVALLFVAYLQVSRTYPENSDESNDLLMAWDMLHGNVLLHGWYLSDVSFITTELPQYALLVRLFGLHTDTAHIAAAMTYTLVVILAVLLARGTVSRREAWPRMLLTAGLMFAPQLGVGVFILLLSLGHIGTAVPLMLTWLVIDRCPARWLVPVVVGLLLTWVLVADPLVLMVGVVPLVAVCAVRVARELRRRRQDAAGGRASLRARWYELSLAVAAILAQGLASLAGLPDPAAAYLHPVPLPAGTGAYLAQARLGDRGRGCSRCSGPSRRGRPSRWPSRCCTWPGWRWSPGPCCGWRGTSCQLARHDQPDPARRDGRQRGAYVPSTLADATDLNAREFAVVLPFGAVLAGRTLAVGLRDSKRRWARPARWPALAGALLAGYAASLGYAAAQPSVPAANAQLATFLAAHHLTRGIGGYWESSVVTVGSDGAVTIRAVLPGTLQPDLWEAKSSWYDPARTGRRSWSPTARPGSSTTGSPTAPRWRPWAAPARTYHVGPYTVYVWDKNLLADLPHQ